jgi:hypothetical protein
VRYADDFLILVRGSRAQAENLRDDAEAVLAAMGLRPVGGRSGVQSEVAADRVDAPGVSGDGRSRVETADAELYRAKRGGRIRAKPDSGRK